MSFSEKLSQRIAAQQSLLVVALDPNPEMMPAALGPGSPSLIEQLEPWLCGIIEQTQRLVCAYKPTLGFYEALGSEGLALLRRILSCIPGTIPVILDAKHSDLNTSTIFARAIFEDWHVDAVTLTPFAGQDHSAPFLVYPEKGVFVLCHTSNPGALALQNFPAADNPFYLQVVHEVQTWGPPEQLYLEVGTHDLDVLRQIRQAAPERTLLLRSIWAEGSDLEAILRAGLNPQADGLLLPVPQDYLQAPDLGEHLQSLNTEIMRLRQQAAPRESACDLWVPDLCFLAPHPHQDLILQLFDIDCLLFGEYVQASGATFSYYIDLRRIISNPQIFHQVLAAYAEILQTLSFDRIAGIPYGSLPTATGLSLLLHYPMIYPRKEVKAHGTRRLIEGNYQPGETVVMVDDVLISGKSALEGAEKIKSAGLSVEDIVVLIDHEGGVTDRIQQAGYRAHAVLKISDITQTLYSAGRITEAQYQSLQQH